MIVLKVLSIAALMGSVAWLIHSPDYEPLVATITSLSACIASFVVNRRRKPAVSMSQSVGDGSVAVQSGGNLSASEIKISNREK